MTPPTEELIERIQKLERALKHCRGVLGGQLRRLYRDTCEKDAKGRPIRGTMHYTHAGEEWRLQTAINRLDALHGQRWMGMTWKKERR